MARPTKQGVDYFPLDVHLDNKFKFIEIKFGLEGFATIIKIMQEIYSQSYYCDWSEDEMLLFSSEHNIEIDKLTKITDEAVDRDIFDKTLYEDFKILTSKGIQNRYKEIVRRRKEVKVVEEYLLIDNDLGVNDDINPSSSSQDDNKSTQSKVKYTKEEETKEQIPYAEIIDYLNEKADRNFSNKSSGNRSVIKARWNEDYRVDDFKKVIDVCSSNWKGQTFSNGVKGDEYLRPSTLFNTKFDERLNMTDKKDNKDNLVTPSNEPINMTLPED